MPRQRERRTSRLRPVVLLATVACLVSACAPAAGPPHGRLHPRLVRTADFGFPDGAYGVVSAGGSTWVGAGDSLLRIDDRSDTIRAVRTKPDAGLTTLAAGAGNIWASGTTGVLRLSERTGRLTGRISGLGGQLAFGEGFLWVLPQRVSAMKGGSLVRVDPATLALRRYPIPCGKLGGFAVGEGGVWISIVGFLTGAGCPMTKVCSHGGACLLRVDPTDGRIEAEIPGPFAFASVATGDGAVWASDGSSVERIDPLSDGVVRTTSLGEPVPRAGVSPSFYGSGLLAVTPSAVWVAVTDSRNVFRLTRISPRTGAIAGNGVELFSYPAALVASRMTAFVLRGNDSLVRVDAVDCAATCRPPAPPAPTVPLARRHPLFLQSLSMFSTKAGWAIAIPFDTGLSETGGPFLARTLDGGRTWHDVMPLPPGSDYFPQALDALSPDHAYLAVSAGGAGNPPATIFETDDGGTSWRRLSSFDAHGAPSAVDFVDISHGFLLVDSGAAMGSEVTSLYRTADGGESWHLVARTPPIVGARPPGLGGLPLYCDKGGLAFETGDVGWISLDCNGGGGAVIAATRDGGQHWSVVRLPTPRGACPEAPCEVATPQIVSSTAFAPVVASPAFLLVTHDGGLSWSIRKLPAAAGDNPQIGFVNATTGFLVPEHPGNAGNTAGRLYTTVDGALHWHLVSSRIVPGQLDFVSSRVAFASDVSSGGNVPEVGSSIDGGRSWRFFVPEEAP